MNNWKDRWEIVERIGQGGQGSTDRVRDSGGQEAVLKLLNQDKEKDLKARKRMADEANNLQAASSFTGQTPRLIEHNTVDFADTSVPIYLVMELIPGKTLDRILSDNNKRLPLEKSAQILLALSETVALLHQYDIVHRDLKPKNLMVRDVELDDIVLLDFGLSYNRARKQEGVTDAGETIKNELIWLPEATSGDSSNPEDRRDYRSDITCLVALFFCCIVGRMPGQFRNDKNYPPHRWPGCRMTDVFGNDPRAAQLEMFFETGFEWDRRDRFQSMSEMKQRLTHAIAGTAPQPSFSELDVGLAKRLSNSDRTFRLHKMRPIVNSIFTDLGRQSGRLRRLEAFSVTVARMEVYDKTDVIGDGLDVVGYPPIYYQMSVSGRPEECRVIRFCLVSRGNSCSLYYQISQLRKGQHMASLPPQQKGEWQELDWFPSTGPPKSEQVATWADRALAAAAVSLAKDLS